MKSVSVATAAAVLAGMAIAQPHGHHHHGHHHHAKRALSTEWEIVWETVTVVVEDSTTQTLFPTPTGNDEPGQFFQTPSSTLEPVSTPTLALTSSAQPSIPSTTVVPSSSSQELPSLPPAETTSSTSTSSSTSSTSTATSFSTSIVSSSSTSTSSTPIPTPTPSPSSSSTPVPTPTSTSTPVLVAVPDPTNVVAPPAIQVPTTVPSPDPRAPDSATGYVYQGADAFGTSAMDSKIFSGQITYYTLGIGACGYDDSGKDLTDNIVAISKADWMTRNTGTSLGIDMPNHPWCDQYITITAGNGASTRGIVRDNCPGCVSGSIDVSEAIFNTLFGGLELGRTEMTWEFS